MLQGWVKKVKGVSKKHKTPGPKEFIDTDSSILFFFKLFFIDYAITVILIFSLLPQLPQAIPKPLFVSMGHAYKFFGYSVSYTVLHIPVAIL